MARIPTIKLFSPSGDFVIVEPGTEADKQFRSRGYSEPFIKKEPEQENTQEDQSLGVLFPKKRGPGRPKKRVEDIGKTNHEKAEDA